MFSLCCWPDPVVECPDCVEAARAWVASLAVERQLHCCQVLARFIRQSHLFFWLFVVMQENLDLGRKSGSFCII
jgi:hypothetical protein